MQQSRLCELSLLFIESQILKTESVSSKIDAFALLQSCSYVMSEKKQSL